MYDLIYGICIVSYIFLSIIHIYILSQKGGEND